MNYYESKNEYMDDFLGYNLGHINQSGFQWNCFEKTLFNEEVLLFFTTLFNNSFVYLVVCDPYNYPLSVKDKQNTFTFSKKIVKHEVGHLEKSLPCYFLKSSVVLVNSDTAIETLNVLKNKGIYNSFLVVSNSLINDSNVFFSCIDISEKAYKINYFKAVNIFCEKGCKLFSFLSASDGASLFCLSSPQ